MDFQQLVLLQQLEMLTNSLSTTADQVQNAAKDVGKARSVSAAKAKTLMIEGYLKTVKQEIVDIEEKIKIVDGWNL